MEAPLKTLLALVLLFPALTHAVTLAPLGLHSSEGAQDFKRLVEEVRGDATHSGRIEFESADTRYENGDFVLLWSFGARDQDIVEDEYKMMWDLMNTMARRRFRVVMDTRATIRSFRDAVETQGNSVVLFSGHGNETGFYDWQGRRAPYNIFARKAPSVYQVILAACFSREALPLYNPPEDLRVYTWSGETNTDHMFRLLQNGRWTGLEGKDLGPRE